MDADKICRDKARREPRKNATSYIEKILEAIPQEIAAVPPLTSHS